MDRSPRREEPPGLRASPGRREKVAQSEMAAPQLAADRPALLTSPAATLELRPDSGATATLELRQGPGAAATPELRLEPGAAATPELRLEPGAAGLA